MSESTLRTIGVTALRVGFGATLITHGVQKLFGWLGGYGPDGTGQFFESIGFKPGRQSAIASGAAEAGGGALLVLRLPLELGGAGVPEPVVERDGALARGRLGLRVVLGGELAEEADELRVVVRPRPFDRVQGEGGGDGGSPPGRLSVLRSRPRPVSRVGW